MKKKHKNAQPQGNQFKSVLLEVALTAETKKYERISKLRDESPAEGFRLFAGSQLVDPSTLTLDELRILLQLFKYAVSALNHPNGYDGAVTEAQAFLRANNTHVDADDLEDFFQFCLTVPGEQIAQEVDEYWALAIYFAEYAAQVAAYRKHYGGMIGKIPRPFNLHTAVSFRDYLFGGQVRAIRSIPEQNEGLVQWDGDAASEPKTEDSVFMAFPIADEPGTILLSHEPELSHPEMILSWQYVVGVFPKQEPHKIGDMVTGGQFPVKSVIVTPELKTEIIFQIDAATLCDWKVKSTALKLQLESAGLCVLGFSVATFAHHPSSGHHLVYLA